MTRAATATDAAMARALIEVFGDRAGEVARRQRALADGEAATSWDAIIAILDPV